MSARRLALGLFALALLAAPPRGRAQAIAAGLGGNPSALVGDSLDVPVVVDMTARTDRIGAFALRITWNPAVLRLQSGLSGSFGQVTSNLDSAAQGVVRLAGVNPAGAGGLVTLGIGRFVVLAADTTTLTLAFSELYAATTYANLLPSLTTGSGTFCVAQGRYGDINGDGAVNSGDALIALTNAVGLGVGGYAVALGDVSADGVTDTRDALVMLSAAVGIDVSAFPRLGQVLGGACATGAMVAITIRPALTADMLVGQSLTFEVRASGPTGALMPIPNAVLRSSDTTVLAFEGGVDPATALARAPGTATVTAVRDARDSVQAIVTVVARRSTHWVDAKAVTAANQLGTATMPFATFAAALAVAQGGDTIRPQPGRYPEELRLDSALVLMGDTLPDGTRPTLTGTGTGISMWTEVPQEIHHLALDGFGTGLDVEGPTRLVLDGLVTSNVDYAVFTDMPLASLRILNSRLLGRGASSYSSSEGVELYGSVDTLVIAGTEVGDFYYGGVYAGSVDSMAIHASRIHDVGGYGIDAWGAGAGGTLAFVMDSTTVSRATGTVSLSGVRSAVLSHNSLSSSGGEGGNGLSVGGAGQGWVRIHGDSSDAPGYYWLYATALDSVVVDSVRMGLGYGQGYVTDVRAVRIESSRFVNVTGTPLYVAYSSLGGRVALDDVVVTGDPRCDLCATGFMLNSATTVANRVVGVNLSQAIFSSGDSSLTVTNSQFSHVGSAITWSVTDSGVPAQLTVAHNTFTGFDAGVVASRGNAVRVDSNAFRSSLNPAVQIAPLEGTVQVVGNSFADVYGAINVAPAQNASATISDNTASGVAGYGIIAGVGTDAANVAYQIQRNAVACNPAGAASGYGIEVEWAGSVVDGNQVQGCWAGITALASTGANNPVTGHLIGGNTVALPPNGHAGIYVEGAVQAQVTGNLVTADTSTYLDFGDIYVSGAPSGTGLVKARVDSNVVRGGSTYGVYVAGVDSAAVRFNTVERVVNAGWAGSTYGGGVVIGNPVRRAGTIYGNLVRRIGGVGIAAYNFDTATVSVDSNLVSATPADSFSTAAGIQVGAYIQVGPLLVRGNRVTGITGPYANGGIYIYYADPARTLLDSNYIAGNSTGMYASSNGTFQAPNNWWGSASGPSCSTCNGQGDPVGTYINFSPWLSAPPPSGLPQAAPITRRFVAAMRAPVAASASPTTIAPPAGGIGALGRVAVRGAPPGARAVPATAPGRRVVQQALARRAAAAAARDRELAGAAQAFAAQAPQWTARVQAVVRATAERDSARAARVAERVAAQRAQRAQATQERRP